MKRDRGWTRAQVESEKKKSERERVGVSGSEFGIEGVGNG